MQTSQFELAIAAVSTGFTYSNALLVGGQPLLALEIVNGAAAAMADFKIQAQDNDNGEWYDYLTSTDFTAGVGSNLLFISARPDTLTAGAKAHLHVRSNGIRSFRFAAKLANGTGTVTVRGSKTDL
jgi:hypothetical protein